MKTTINRQIYALEGLRVTVTNGDVVLSCQEQGAQVLYLPDWGNNPTQKEKLSHLIGNLRKLADCLEEDLIK